MTPLAEQADFFRSLYLDMYLHGKDVSPRGCLVREIENHHQDIAPGTRFTNFAARGFNLDYIKREILWYLKGDKYDLSIGKYAAIWRAITVYDPHAKAHKPGWLNSNYGQYIFQTPSNAQQPGIEWVVEELTRDRDSRRASILILDHTHTEEWVKDVPCTYSINFRIRENKLEMSVHMRSQDLIYGYTNDLPAFSFIHEMTLRYLQVVYPSLEWGNYHHTVDSMHVYERHFDMLRTLAITENPFFETPCPLISGAFEVDFLRNIAGVREEDRLAGAYKIARTAVKPEWTFTKWLLEVDAK